MRVGIYIGNQTPTIGGAYTLLATLKRDIVSSDCKYEIFFFFDDEPAPLKIIDNEIVYINIHQELCMASIRINFMSRVKRKLLRLFGLYHESIPTPTFDDILHRESIDLLWILGPYPITVTVPYVYTVWDLGHRMVPFFPEVSAEGWKWNDRENLYQKMLYRATYIITGNETGKKEIIANYAVNPEKIHIIPFPVPGFCFEKIEIPESLASVKPNVNSPFVFYPAQFWAHKNHIALIEAIAWIRDKKNITINCYFSGSDQGNLRYVNDMIAKYKLENQVFILGFVAQETIVYLYKNALAMTFVSLMGPNNLPPLEAAALGCPLIFSNIPGHLEQTEGTGIPVDATNPEEIGEAIISIYNNPDFRQRLISGGLALAERYRNYSYFSEMLKLLDSFALYRKTWGA